jgi:pimeloyl-ACP methyl ester carboxylesterase
MHAFSLTSPRALLRYHDFPGDGVPLLFVHGLGCAASCDYPRVAADPALAGRRRLLVDLLGAGFSDRPESFAYTVEAHRQTLVEWIDGLALDTVDVFGHSAGGAVAIVLAARSPRVRKLALSEPNLDPGGGFFSRQIAGQPEAAFIREGHAAMVRHQALSGDAIWAGSLAAASPAAVHRLATSLVRGSDPSWRQQLLALSIPRTVLYGQRSLPDPDAESLAAAGLAVRIVPNAGHSMAW